MKQTPHKNPSRYSKKRPRCQTLTPEQRARFRAAEPERRKFIDTSDVEKLNDITKPSAQRTIRRIKDARSADRSTRLTLSDFCSYYNVDQTDAEAFLKFWLRSPKGQKAPDI